MSASKNSHLEPDFYARQVCLPEIGEAKQGKLKSARVLLVGVGGLGCPAFQYLVLSGVGRITICEPDCVEMSNLHRQPLYSFDDVGQEKAHVASRWAKRHNPWVEVVSVVDRFELHNAQKLVQKHDLVLDCSDNFSTNYLIHDVCQMDKVDLVSACIHSFEGLIHRYKFREIQAPCLRCRTPEIPEEACTGTCSERGVIGALPGVFGSLQAEVALHHLLEIETLKHATSWMFDLRSMQSREISWQRNLGCPLCSSKASLEQLHKPSENFVLESYEVGRGVLIDIREGDEVETTPAPVHLQAKHHPLSQWNNGILESSGDVVLFCAKGVRSAKLARRLRGEGYGQVYSLRGGVGTLG